MRRRLLTIAVFGLIGAALSFGSAWGCIFWRVFVAKRYLGAGEGTVVPGAAPAAWPADWPPPEQVDVTRGFGYERRMAWRQTLAYHDIEPIPPPDALTELDLLRGYSVFRPLEGKEAEALTERMQRYSTLIQGVGGQLKTATSQSTFWRASGWPMLCMRSSWLDERTTEFSRTGGVVRQSGGRGMDLNTDGWTPGLFYDRGIPWPHRVPMPDGTTMGFTLPLAPIWPGFLANAAFWGGAVWLAWRGVIAVRRRLRHRKGCCAHCGYPTGVSNVCTECGRALGPAEGAS